MNKIEEKIKQIEQTLEELKKEIKQSEESDFRRKAIGEYYYYLRILGGELDISKTCEEHTDYDISCFENNDYFHTEERANEVLEKIKFLLKTERFYDMYCSDYIPNWKSSKSKYYVRYSNVNNRFGTDYNVIRNYSENYSIKSIHIKGNGEEIIITPQICLEIDDNGDYYLTADGERLI